MFVCCEKHSDPVVKKENKKSPLAEQTYLSFDGNQKKTFMRRIQGEYNFSENRKNKVAWYWKPEAPLYFTPFHLERWDAYFRAFQFPAITSTTAFLCSLLVPLRLHLQFQQSKTHSKKFQRQNTHSTRKLVIYSW